MEGRSRSCVCKAKKRDEEKRRGVGLNFGNGFFSFGLGFIGAVNDLGFF